MSELTAAERAPRFEADAFACPLCDAYAHQDWEQLYSDRGTEGYEKLDDRPNELSGSGWWVSWCGRCRGGSFWRGSVLIHPRGSAVPVAHSDMPDDARLLYDEAREVYAVSPRAGAALARAALERLLRTIDPVDVRIDLAGRIDRVLPEVSSSLGQVLTVLRHVGNKSLHVEDEPDEATVLVLDDEQTDLAVMVFDSINSLVDELVTKRTAADSAFAKLPPGVRARVEGLLGKKGDA